MSFYGFSEILHEFKALSKRFYILIPLWYSTLDGVLWQDTANSQYFMQPWNPGMTLPVALISLNNEMFTVLLLPSPRGSGGGAQDFRTLSQRPDPRSCQFLSED